MSKVDKRPPRILNNRDFPNTNDYERIEIINDVLIWSGQHGDMGFSFPICFDTAADIFKAAGKTFDPSRLVGVRKHPYI